MIRRPPRSTLFPYTDALPIFRDKRTEHEYAQWGADVRAEAMPGAEPALPEGLHRPPAGPLNRRRSEEHTSELQSRRDLVCRLLLEKKKKKRRDVTCLK